MLDLGYLRKNFDDVQARLAARGDSDWLGGFRDIDARRRAAITEMEGLKAKRNTLSAEVAKAKKAGENADEAIRESREIGPGSQKSRAMSSNSTSRCKKF